MQLFEAFRLPLVPCLAVVGAGGKTTALFRLGREFLERVHHQEIPGKVILTTTTHMGAGQAGWADHHRIVQDLEGLEWMEGDFPTGLTLFTGAQVPDGRLGSLAPDVLDRLYSLAQRHQIPLLIEADGSRLKSLKAPASHEPVIPPFVETVVVVAGLSGIGKPLSDKWVHRPEIFAGLSGLSLGEPVTPQPVVSVLCHPDGGLKHIPTGARRMVLLNQADTPQLQSIAGLMAEQLLPSFQAVVIASLLDQPGLVDASLPTSPGLSASPVFATYEKIAGIVLAAGDSSRFGQSKQLLEWRGEPFIRHISRTALRAGLSPVIIVSGEQHEEIRMACGGLPVLHVHNPDWQAGQSKSLQCGLRHLSDETGGAVFFLADQPQIPDALVRLLLETHAAGLQPVVAPLVDGQRSNPVLFDRDTFPDLMALQGDVGGRALFSKYPIAWVPWHDSRILLDVDTPRDYQTFLEVDPG